AAPAAAASTAAVAAVTVPSRAEPAPARTTTAPADAGAASITVTFPSGSAELTPEAQAALAPLGRALASSDLAAFRFRIEGHTDSVGARDANQSLSERRAAAVRDYLVQRFGVNAARLEIVGRGEDDLLVPTRDEVPERRNRRVQVVNLGN
ncbi:OmpA family protein, partial [Falsiroseomonas oryzae]|uniref:OmpA family protein n=1 Tax=Falsiroseomonas oryzae TaxID=2766473 RepID=UPI0022EAA3F0